MIAEIFYRVKKAEWGGGEITVFWDDSNQQVYPDMSETYVAPSIPPFNDTPFHQFGDYGTDLPWYYTRGYTATVPVVSDEVSIPYMGDEYPAIDAALYRRDIGDNERGMWLEDFGSRNGDGAQQRIFATVFSYDSYNINYYDYGTPDHVFLLRESYLGDPPFSQDFGTNFSVVFTGEIAVVKASPDNHLLSPSNSFYIGIRVRSGRRGEPLAFSFGISGISSVPQEEEGLSEYIHCGNYEINFGGTNPTCKLYCYPFLGSDTVTDPVGTIYHVPTEWWPYAKGSPAEPVWDSETGMPWVPPP